MQSVLIVIHLIVVIALVIVVLLQRSEGGMGLGGGGGGISGFMTGRGQANALTRTTAILAAVFFCTSLILSVLASHNRTPRSILDGATPTAPATVPGAPSAPAPAGGGVLDQLRQMQDQSGAQPPRPSAPPQ
ncbi:MAG: preprotein translocase subunit SecG [Hyphomicrobiales bacterium]|jgi:preprotein translocase subunit SecG|nr:preprotein translocase subunit SecG [Hyphomicrobiales bacterium]